MDEMVIQFFNMGFYNIDDMKLFVQVQWITKEQYKKTTGIDYVEPLPLSNDHEHAQSEATSEAPVADTPASGVTSEAEVEAGTDDAEVTAK